MTLLSSIMSSIMSLGRMEAAMWVCVGCVTLYIGFLFIRAVLKKFGFGEQLLPFTTRFGEWAIVTGSTHGIGRSVAALFAKAGMKVLLVGGNAEELKDTKTAIERQRGCRNSVNTLFLDSPNSRAFKAEIERRDVGIVFNNVGLKPSAQAFTDISPEQLEELSANARSAQQITEIVFAVMKEQKRGAIIFAETGHRENPNRALSPTYQALRANMKKYCESLELLCSKSNLVLQCHTPESILVDLDPSKPEHVEMCAKQLIRDIASGKVKDEADCHVSDVRFSCRF